jgi:hypothetical protein
LPVGGTGSPYSRVHRTCRLERSRLKASHRGRLVTRIRG